MLRALLMVGLFCNLLVGCNDKEDAGDSGTPTPEADADTDTDTDTDTDITGDEISDIQTGVIETGASAMLVGAVVTSQVKSFLGDEDEVIAQGFFVQAPGGGEWRGLWIYVEDPTEVTVTIGDLVNITGVVEEYYDMTELLVAATADVEVVGADATVVIADVDASDVSDWESYESVLVALSDVTVLSDMDSAGECALDIGIPMDDFLWSSDGTIGAGDTIDTLQGIVSYSYGSFSVEPRSDDDIIGHTEAPCPADACVEDLSVGDLVVTEIMFDPSCPSLETACSDSAHEWIEVLNNTAGTVDFKGLVIADDSGDSESILVNLIVGAGEYAVLASGDGESWTYGFTPHAHYGSLSLGNSGDAVSVGTGETTLDTTATYGAGETEPGHSWQLSNTMLSAADNDDAANWCSSTLDIGDGSGDVGTPGAANEACSGL